MNVLTSKRGLMHIPGVNALICASVKQDVAPKDHLSSISTFLTLFWCDFIWQNDLILHVHSEKCEMNDEWGEQFPGKHQTRVRIYIEYAYAYDGMIRRDLSFQHVFLYERSFCNNGSDSKDKTKPQIHENQFCLITLSLHCLIRCSLSWLSCCGCRHYSGSH